ncbi:MAG: hypothetical protein NTV03_00900 [Candidatus Nomurabacteria bacterium]|nr:hypothetical protein [Candidatus Nomurabacteria bacterium]
MGFKSYITKKVLQMKGMSKDQAEQITKQLEDNPELAASLKALEGDKEVKALFEKITKEIDEKKKAGTAEQYAAILVMNKYKAELMKHREALAPLMSLIQK